MLGMRKDRARDVARQVYASGVAHYLFNCVNRDPAKWSEARERAAALLGVRMWGVDADEPHRDALAAGDLALIYLGTPEQVFIGRTELASAVHAWTPSEAHLYPGAAPAGVSLAEVEQWNLAVPMENVLERINPSAKNQADFPVGVVRITANEYETTLDLAASP